MNGQTRKNNMGNNKKKKNWWEQPKEKHIVNTNPTPIQEPVVEAETPQQGTQPIEMEKLIGMLALGFLVAFIAAPLLQFCAIMTDLFCGIFGIMSGAIGSEVWAEETKNSFFYVNYWQAYAYAVALWQMAIIWCEKGDSMWRSVLKIIITTYFAVVSMIIPQLFLSMAIGPIFIFFCFTVTAKR